MGRTATHIDLKWEEPASPPGPRMSEQFARRLKKRPGEFSRLATYETPGAASRTRINMQQELGNGFEFMVKGTRVYGRFLGTNGRPRKNGRS